MNEYKEVILGFEAIEYIAECLAEGKTLAHFLMQCCELKKGFVSTLLPVYVSEHDAKDFKEGQHKVDVGAQETLLIRQDGTEVVGTSVPTTDWYLISAIKDFFAAKADGPGMCLFEDASAEPTDAWIARERPKIYVYRDEIYHPVLRTDTEKEIDEVICRVADWLLIGVMASVSPETLQLKKGEITETQLREVANQAEKIVIGAYDGEGYLIWHGGNRG